MTRRALVTGGAGFLGSHVCERLVADGFDVTCVDNFLTGDASNVEHLSASERFRLVDHDITYRYVPEHPPSIVLHLASPASPPRYLANPIPTLMVGSAGTMNALDLAREAEATFLLASTSEIYGDPEVHPQPESYRGSVSTIGPRSVYDEAKRFAEAATMAYHRAYGVDTRIVRIFNTYGPRLAPGDGRVISNFIKQSLTGDPITIYGDGSQTRSFCYVDDLVEGLMLLLAHGDADPVNLGNPAEWRVADLATLVVELTGSSSKVVFEPLPEDDPRVRKPDITRARQVLGWEPNVSLEEGLRRTIPWFEEVLGVAVGAEARSETR